jgi:hypothetical protein
VLIKIRARNVTGVAKVLRTFPYINPNVMDVSRVIVQNDFCIEINVSVAVWNNDLGVGKACSEVDMAEVISSLLG